MTRTEQRLDAARGLQRRLEQRLSRGWGFAPTDAEAAFLLDLVKAEIFRRERIQQQVADDKRRRQAIRVVIGP